MLHLQEVDDICKTKLHDLKPNPVLGTPDPKSVQAWTHIDARASLASAHRKLQRLTALSELQGGGSSSAAAASRAAAADAVGGKGWRKLVEEYRRRLLHVVKAKYGEDMHHHQCSVLQSPEPDVVCMLLVRHMRSTGSGCCIF
jgi:hypothetical protein